MPSTITTRLILRAEADASPPNPHPGDAITHPQRIGDSPLCVSDLDLGLRLADFRLVRALGLGSLLTWAVSGLAVRRTCHRRISGCGVPSASRCVAARAWSAGPPHRRPGGQAGAPRRGARAPRGWAPSPRRAALPPWPAHDEERHLARRRPCGPARFGA